MVISGQFWVSGFLRSISPDVFGIFPKKYFFGPWRVLKISKNPRNISFWPFLKIFLDHRHVTPRWKSHGFRIMKKIMGHFELFGPKNGPKRVIKPLLGPKIFENIILQNIGMWPLVGNCMTSESWKKYFWVILSYLGQKMVRKGSKNSLLGPKNWFCKT